jgi:hypothetical protein
MRAMDVIRGIDLLISRPDVDPTRVHAFGKDKGAVPALYAAVLDDRIEAIALEGMLASYEIVTRQRIHRQVFEDAVVGVLNSFDLPELVAAVAPRPVSIVDAADALGHRLDMAAVRAEYEPAARVFQAAGAAKSLQMAHRRPNAPFSKTYEGWINSRSE